MVGTRRDELRDQVRVTRMDLHAVESALTRPIHRLTEFLNEVLDLRYFQTTVNGRTVEVEPRIGTHRHAMTGVEMRHVSAVTELDRGFRSFRMDGVCHLLHIRYNLRTDIELTVKRNTTQIDCTIRYGGHSDSTVRYGYMVVLQLLCRRIRTRHILKSSAADNTIPQRDRSQFIGGKKFIFH